ncbi:isoleucine--tRNA ligase [Luteibaculum oceani]|uniref:Isoleucine--tRNA ligase n=1 Tax=Luteibaculum oceani TaxID=1294296 RepID=A0A5C6VLK9_9FLAO|nr:isoleucine--tRNA ligase [Luteibaculum oceani]TXC85336.1 isoleucine--tRNA ligase [Luteibaculum oceani]
MAKSFKEYDQLNLPKIADEVLAYWKSSNTFKKSERKDEDKTPFVFYEGPPSANGLPGIHHVLSRSIKDIFCRYKTLKGYSVNRKAGWDTHGLPVELGVEKELGITKEDIGSKITIDEYNEACKKAVMKYTDVWGDLTEKMGYWVDMDQPYITYKPKYMESVWWLLKQIYSKDLLYKGYTIQPYSPKAGTGLSSHELNQPGCYKNVKDSTIVAQFKLVDTDKIGFDNVHFLAWTTTPWTLPSNTALTVGPKIKYVLVDTYNQYTNENVKLILAEALVNKNFGKKYFDSESLDYNPEKDKKIPYKILKTFTGAELVGLKYEQLLPYALPYQNPEKAFRIIEGDFVTTEDGTGIVHTAPTFGADDARVAEKAGVPPMLILNENGNLVPLVDLRGKFVDQISDETFGLGGEYVKAEYLTEEELATEFEKQKEALKSIIPNLKNYLSVDERIGLKLKLEGKAFKIEKYEHSYPHCWRTDKPVLYYPLDSWFIKTTAVKDRLINLNKEINWKPESTGTGRFGNWLENLNDWNLSRSRFWGIPIPIWRSEDGKEIKCIGSVEELTQEIEKSIAAGVMKTNPFEGFVPNDFSEENYDKIDLHKHIVDEIVLVSDSGDKLFREKDLIDVWFDSGSMPYAQLHYPFENKDLVDQQKAFPADFIAEGVDQTRGWFFTLHVIGALCFDSVAYKNVVSNGLVLDKNGQKMSKRLGNAVDPFKTLSQYGPDATRWYMITNAQPWDNLKFDEEGIVEIQRKFFRALHNCYSFFALYANVDGFSKDETIVPLQNRPEIDRWIISKLNSLCKQVDAAFEAYEPTKAGRLIQEFVVNDLSNWYVRLCRKRFWRGDYTEDKIAAYQTLMHCLEVVAVLSSPIAPFYMDQLFRNLNPGAESVHLQDMPIAKAGEIDEDLEERMGLAQKICSIILSIRKQENIRVRQPLLKAMVPVMDNKVENQIKAVEDLILAEVNLKQLELIKDDSVFVKTIKPNFKKLGPIFGKQMKAAAGIISAFNQDAINALEKSGEATIEIEGANHKITTEDVEISTKDIPGWRVASEGGITVALDLEISEELKREGIARELVNRIQNFRKEKGLEVTDRIMVKIQEHGDLAAAVNANKDYICSEVLADELELVSQLNSETSMNIEIEEGFETRLELEKTN